MKGKKRKRMQPQWKVTLLWIYFTLALLLAASMIYFYQFPKEFNLKSENREANLTCIMYKGAGYCCENKYWLLITDIDIYDNITDDNISVTDCFRLKKI